MTGLTPRDALVLDYLKRTITDSYCPTFDQIAIACGLAGRSHVSRALDSLESKGWVTRGRHRLRSIELTDPLAGKSTAELVAMRERIDGVLAGRAQ